VLLKKRDKGSGFFETMKVMMKFLTIDLDDEPPVLTPIKNLPPLKVELPLEVVNHEPAPA